MELFCFKAFRIHAITNRPIHRKRAPIQCVRLGLITICWKFTSKQSNVYFIALKNVIFFKNIESDQTPEAILFLWDAISFLKIAAQIVRMNWTHECIMISLFLLFFFWFKHGRALIFVDIFYRHLHHRSEHVIDTIKPQPINECVLLPAYCVMHLKMYETISNLFSLRLIHAGHIVAFDNIQVPIISNRSVTCGSIQFCNNFCRKPQKLHIIKNSSFQRNDLVQSQEFVEFSK